MNTDLELVLIAPTVISTVSPDATALLQARACFRDPVIQTALRRDFSVETLTEVLARQGVPGASELAQYLVDEHTQLGNGVYLFSQTTGRIRYHLREEDIYLPEPVPREDGTLAQPLPQIRPEILAALTLQEFEEERELEILVTLANRGCQTLSLDDPRLLVASRKGRKQIVRDLEAKDPYALLRACGGTSAAFLGAFELVETPPSEVAGLEYLEGVVSSKSVLGLQDTTSLNLHHDRASTLRAVLAQGWVREIACTLAHIPGNRTPLSLERMRELIGVWVAAPHLIRPIRERHPNLAVLPMMGPTYCLGPNAGYLRIPETFKVNNFEVFDRWETTTYLPYEIWYDPAALRRIDLTGMDESSQVLLVDCPM